MKYGIYYAFWEREWGGDYLPYIEKVKNLGFDVLEISAAGLVDKTDAEMQDMARRAKEAGLILTAGYGPAPKENIASADVAIRANALDFYGKLFAKLAKADIHTIGGGLYSYWPVDYSGGVDKEGDWARSVEGVQKMADMAAQYDITLGMEVLNRFEGYLLNTCAEAVKFVKQVGKSNVKIMLDTFHMNIEEDSFTDAIHMAGDMLGHFHIGEANRRLPGQGRIPWEEIGQALRDVHYNGYVVMEPFILSGGQVGNDIKVFRDMTEGKTSAQIDEDTRRSVDFVRKTFEG